MDASPGTTVGRLNATNCGHGMDAEVGQTVIVALGVQSYGERLSPAWVFWDSGRLKYSDVSGTGRSLQTVLAAIDGELPPTDARGASVHDDLPWFLLIPAAGASAWFLRRQRSSAP